MDRGPKVMEDWVWKKIIDESRGRGIIYRPFMINEPFVDPKMPEIIRYIKQDSTAKTEFNSNGHFSVKTDVKALLEAGIDYVRFSVDGFSEESFKQSGRGGKYSEIVENIHNFIKERNRQKSKCFIELRMINLECNRHERESYVEYWKRYADAATITDLYEWPWSGQTEPYRKPCPKIRHEMFFMVDGRATICCWDAFGRTIIGDIKTNSVEEIWNGEILHQYKAYLDKGEREKILLCSRCDAYKGYDFSNWQGY
jgi:MoaA/NifB/PqqE/SkfB family radical SAM enzyme